MAARSVLAQQAPAVSAVFSKGMSRGSEGSDVKRLQQLLNSYGAATENAVKKFQVKYGIAGPGDPGYGEVGPKTRAKLENVFSGVPAASVAQPSPVAASVSPVFTRTLTRGTTGEDVKRLQQLLNSDADTRIAASGVGSAGNETTFYGAATENAVKKFQKKYGIVSSGTPETTGYGLVGPGTRAKMKEVFGE
ncbi:MAG: peptidoglycan-binding protein [Parcubacteria group bacterium]|nr:peptidoglycan-binding protein [Parcubacteria group bacterium]